MCAMLLIGAMIALIGFLPSALNDLRPRRAMGRRCG